MKVTADDIAQLLASAPPRLVPAHVTGAAQRRNAPLIGAVVGVFFALMGIFFAWAFFPWRFWDDLRLAASSPAAVPGIVTAVNRTGLRVNKQQVMDTTFIFKPPGGRTQVADCYSTGRRWSIGESVTVRYLPGDTAVACIEGGRLNEAGLSGALIIIFPLIGVALVVRFVRQRASIRHLLTNGLTAEVDILSVEQTNTRVNKLYVYKVTLSGPASGGPPLTIRRSNPAEIQTMERYAAQKQPVFVLYDPRKPARLIFPEGLIET